MERRQKNTWKVRAESALRKKEKKSKRLSKTNASHALSCIARAKQHFFSDSFVDKVLDAI